jgi:hypothetical protein
LVVQPATTKAAIAPMIIAFRMDFLLLAFNPVNLSPGFMAAGSPSGKCLRTIFV